MSTGFDNSSTAAVRATAWSRITSKIIQWRDWKLAVKLTAVVLVPLCFALALGILQIRGQIGQADEYSRLSGVVIASDSLQSATTRLQQERTDAVKHLTQQDEPAGSVQDAFAATDQALAQSTSVRQGPDFTSSQVVRSANAEVTRRLTQISAARQQVMDPQTDPSVAAHSYSEMIGAITALDRTLIGEISSPQLSSTTTALHDLNSIDEEIHLQHALVLARLDNDDTNSSITKELNASETRRTSALDEFRAVATPQQRRDYDRLQRDPAVQNRQVSLSAVMDSAANTRRSSTSVIPAQLWDEQSGAWVNALGRLESRVDDQLHRRASALQDSASNAAGTETVILVSALLLAGAVVVVIGRQLLGSLYGLRRSALDTANAQLPRAVANIRAGTSVAMDRIPVDTTEEFGEVARAFDTVQTQAVTLAAEQSELRKSYSDSFVNVSRRSQTLLERQLRLFEQLERDEEDPDQLATLFQLDHLATRMRRNNENLMVLSGSDLTRRFQQPATPADLVRAAISEIEHYPRVVVQPLPDTKIVGYAASDLVRLLAELLDNAANFSAPQTNVVVSGYRRGDGSIGVDIVDRGISMTEAELASANQRLTSDGEIELSTSRRMGLFVVARLAARHGIAVELQAGPNNTGIHATVRLRSNLLLENDISQPAARTNGVTQPVSASHQHNPERGEGPLDWTAIEQGRADPPRPTRNGFHLLEDAFASPTASATAQPPNGAVAADPPPPADQPSSQQHHLFTPEHQDDQAASNGEDNGHTGADTPTPIFDDLASAWFQTSSAPPSRTPGEIRWPTATGYPSNTPSERNGGYHPSANDSPGSQGDTPDWKFTSDDARRRAETISASEPVDHTAVGLPVRVPRAHLVAGNAGNNGSPNPERSQRDPELARARLASFQYGRHRHVSGQSEKYEPTGENGAETEWVFPTDHRGEQVESALNHEPDDYTAAGLPRRTPRAQLTPGAAAEPPPDEGSRRDADLMRGRLSNFQRGVREGKHSPRTGTNGRDHR